MLDKNTASRALDFLMSSHLQGAEVADYIRVTAALKQVADGQVVVAPVEPPVGGDQTR